MNTLAFAYGVASSLATVFLYGSAVVTDGMLEWELWVLVAMGLLSSAIALYPLPQGLTFTFIPVGPAIRVTAGRLRFARWAMGAALASLLLHFAVAGYVRSPLSAILAGYSFMLVFGVVITANHGLGFHNMYRFVRRRVDPIYADRMRP